MIKKYVKICLVVPKEVSKGTDNAMYIKKMPVVANFKPQDIEMRVMYDASTKYTVVELYLS